MIGRIATGLDHSGNAGAITFFPPDDYGWFHIDNGPSGGRLTGRLRISGGVNPGDREFISISQEGNIEIGTPTTKSNLTVSGDVFVSGDIQLTGADCAEEFDVDETQTIEPGTVMIIGDDSRLYQSTEPYDKRVAGVLAGARNNGPAIVMGKHLSQVGRLPVALSGKVFCKVDTQYSAIRAGDLLTTSSTPGHAMKVTDSLKAFGAVIGKALWPLPGGRGLIPILVALH